MNRPPFEIPQNFKKQNLWAERKIPDGYSDGNPRHWPEQGQYRPSGHEFYLCVLGQKWAEKDGIAEPGVQYYIDKLPDGYATFETKQPGGPQIYKRLFGHPTGRFYDSVLKFEPHFQWLMSGMEGQCECTMCYKPKPIPRNKAFVHIPRNKQQTDGSGAGLGTSQHPRRLVSDDGSNSSSRASSAAGGIAANRSQRQVRQIGVPQAVDEEGNEDVYKTCVKKLETTLGGKSGIEIDLTEDGSIDWKADRQSLPQHLTQIEQQHSFIPRVGELVMWCPNFLDGHYLLVDPNNSQYKFYSFEQKCFHGFPDWRGGIVAAAPSASVKNGPIDFPDILCTPAKKTALNTAGFRIETMPDPNDDVDKSMSKQYRYVPLRHIRPLTHWRLLMEGIPQDKFHPSVLYALTCMTSISLLEKWRFNGNWPNAHISCRAIYLGPELITIGDTIRLLPPESSGNEVNVHEPDVLIVDSIRYNLIDIKHEHTIPDVPRLSGRSFISFIGQAYTTDPSHPLNPNGDAAPLANSEVKTLFRSVGADEYGPWYLWHGPRQKYEVSHERVLGRLYEADAVRLWMGQRQSTSSREALPKPNLHFDVRSVLKGRRYATETDARLPEPETDSQINWHLADTRAESLAISTLNGIDVGKYHDIRTPATLKQWRIQVKVADGQPVPLDIEDPYIKDLSTIQLYTGAKRGRPEGSKVVDGKLILPGGQQQQRREKYKKDKDVEGTGGHKPSSQMAGAALANNYDTSEEDDEYASSDSAMQYIPDDDDDNDERFNEEMDDSHLLDRFQATRPVKKPLSKADIMKSVEVPAFDIDDLNDREWVANYNMLVRGGTEGSEGSDYTE